jgi:hypothetical protein
MKMTPRHFVAWTLAVGFAFLVGLAGICLSYDVWIADFPRLRALLRLDVRLMPVVFTLLVSAAVPTFIVLLHRESRDRMEFSFLGMKFKGQAAQPVLWALLFLATAFVLVVIRRYVL